MRSDRHFRALPTERHAGSLERQVDLLQVFVFVYVVEKYLFIKTYSRDKQFIHRRERDVLCKRRMRIERSENFSLLCVENIKGAI